MRTDHPTIVLKFGGSVLLSLDRLRVAVHEIYRWRRDGYRVVAVVSALTGRTEELIKLTDTHCLNATPAIKASLIAQGEQESAALLGVLLDRAGIPCSVLGAASIGLRVHGHPLDANPIGLNRDAINSALDRDGVVVIPGFVGIDSTGQTNTLGRGGSDLTAVFIAHQIGAEVCRMIKDVDGLYVADPAKCDPPPARYRYANYKDAHATDGSIVQFKAIEYAKRHGIEFQLGSFNCTAPTTVGAGRSVISQPIASITPARVLVCGLGSVGAGVIELLRQLPDEFEIVGGICRHPAKYAELDIELFDSPSAVEEIDSDLVIELIGGVETAARIVRSAICSGKHVITANKALIAEQGEELRSLADEHGVRLLFSASVGGGVPILEWAQHIRPAVVRGVLNGTSNFVLGQLADGQDVAYSISRAKELGFAEADPSRDLDGRDALDKLIVIAQTLGCDRDLDQQHEGILDALRTTIVTRCTKQVGLLTHGKARVAIQETLSGSVFADLENEWNAVELTTPDGENLTLRGRGAGRWPTSESVLGDALELRRFIESDVQSQEEESHVCVSN